MTENRFVEYYLESLEAIGAELEPDAGIDAPLPIGLPASLVAWYRLAGQSNLNTAHHRLLGPAQLRRDAGRVVFAEENQEVVVWAFEPDGTDDPAVWQGQPRSAAVGAVYEWYAEEQTLSHFIVDMLGYAVDSQPPTP